MSVVGTAVHTASGKSKKRATVYTWVFYKCAIGVRPAASWPFSIKKRLVVIQTVGRAEHQNPSNRRERILGFCERAA